MLRLDELALRLAEDMSPMSVEERWRLDDADVDIDVEEAGMDAESEGELKVDR